MLSHSVRKHMSETVKTLIASENVWKIAIVGNFGGAMVHVALVKNISHSREKHENLM